MKFKRFVAVMLMMIVAVCTGLSSLTVQAASAVWSIEIPEYVESTDQIVLPEGWDFAETTDLSKCRSITVTAVNDETETDIDVIITKISDDSSAKEDSSVGMNEPLLPKLKKSADQTNGSADSDSSSSVGANDNNMQALPNASDDGLPITGASAGLASIAAILLAVAFVIGKNSK
ncbi:MAG: hypothetical protein K6B74_00480 [Ruminococcus sp.]|nr:hypothetical protein [Ruminococcus sp.]